MLCGTYPPTWEKPNLCLVKPSLLEQSLEQLNLLTTLGALSQVHATHYPCAGLETAKFKGRNS